MDWAITVNRFLKQIIGFSCLVISGAVVLGFYLSANLKTEAYDVSCISKTQNDKVTGSSLEPFIKNGTIIRAQYGYYSCNEVQRGDIVLMKYTGYDNALIKIVKALPGDKFEIKQAENNTSGNWNILINNEILKNSVDEPFSLDDNRSKLLKLYATDYKNILPTKAYLIFGDQTSGSTDSTVFGPIPKEVMIAKVSYN